MRLFAMAACAASALLLPSQASAFDWATTVNVTAVEMTFTPDRITFWVDGPAGTCVSAQGLGTQLYWTARGATAEKIRSNGEAALATLMTARASDRPVKIFGRNADCEIEYMYLS